MTTEPNQKMVDDMHEGMIETVEQLWRCYENKVDMHFNPSELQHLGNYIKLWQNRARKSEADLSRHTNPDTTGR